VFRQVLDKLLSVPGVTDRHVPWLCQKALELSGSPFKEAPIDIISFAQPFGFQPYPEAVKRLKAFESKLREEPEFAEVTEFIEADGKGSGKDFRASIKGAYALYWLQCLSNPHKYYNQAPGEPIDLVIVAETYAQARNVTYTKLVERLEKIRGQLWVGTPKQKQYFSGLSQPVEFANYNRGYFDFLHAAMQIRLPHQITLHVAHGDISLPEGTEEGVNVGKTPFDGMNVLLALETEFSALPKRKADAIHGVLLSSGLTRYGRRCSTHVMSYVRDALNSDFTASKYADSQKPENKGGMLGFRGASWEVNEAIKLDPATGEEDMVEFICPETGRKRIPRIFLKEYRTDPVGSAMKYEGHTPRAARGVFPYPWKIDECAYDITPPVRFEPFISERADRKGKLHQYSALRLVEPYFELDWFLDPESVDYQLANIQPIDHLPRVFGLDPAKTHDHYALVGGYPDMLEAELQVQHNLLCRPKLDIVAEWIPSKQYPVDFVNVRLILDILIRLFPNTQKIVFDSWNSQSDIDHLISQGVPAENYSFSLSQQDALYRNAVEMVDNNLVAFPRGALPQDLKDLSRDGPRITSTTNRKHIPDAAVLCMFELRKMRPAHAYVQHFAEAAAQINAWAKGVA